jgi:IMP cyclohydrolase
VRIYLKGKYKYSVDAGDFAQMTRDAMARIDTISFTLDHVTRQGDDRAFASGKHVYNDPDHVKHEVYVSYSLVKEDGHWKIVGAGSSTEPITEQAD